MPLGKAHRNEFRVVLHLQGERREVFVLIEEKGNFYVILPGGPFSLKWHASYHSSGQRHFKVESRRVKEKYLFAAQRQPASVLKGGELILAASLLKGQFQNLRKCTRSLEGILMLDADAAKFRDDIVFVRVFLIEPGLEPDIPSAVNVGPNLVHIVKSTNPWIGIAFFQEKAP